MAIYWKWFGVRSQETGSMMASNHLKALTITQNFDWNDHRFRALRLFDLQSPHTGGGKGCGRATRLFREYDTSNELLHNGVWYSWTLSQSGLPPVTESASCAAARFYSFFAILGFLERLA